MGEQVEIAVLESTINSLRRRLSTAEAERDGLRDQVHALGDELIDARQERDRLRDNLAEEGVRLDEFSVAACSRGDVSDAWEVAAHRSREQLQAEVLAHAVTARERDRLQAIVDAVRARIVELGTNVDEWADSVLRQRSPGLQVHGVSAQRVAVHQALKSIGALLDPDVKEGT